MLRRFTSKCSRGRGIRLHHQLQRGREQERVADLVFLDQAQRALGIEAAAIADDRLAEIERRQQRIHQAAGPRPVGRRPEHVARLRKAVVRMDEAGQVAEQARVRHQRALRRAGRAAGVDDERRVARARVHRRELRRRCRDQRVVVERCRRPAHRRRRSRARVAASLRADRRRGWAATAGRRARPSPRELREPVFERVGAEQERQRHRDRAHLVDRRCARRPSRAAAAGRARPCRRAARPVAASTLDSRLASRCRSQNVCADVAPDSSSQYSAKRVRSAAQRPQQACAMLKCAGTSQRCAAWSCGVVVGGHARSQRHVVARAGLRGYLPARAAGGRPPTVMADVD